MPDSVTLAVDVGCLLILFKTPRLVRDFFAKLNEQMANIYKYPFILNVIHLG